MPAWQWTKTRPPFSLMESVKSWGVKWCELDKVVQTCYVIDYSSNNNAMVGMTVTSLLAVNQYTPSKRFHLLMKSKAVWSIESRSAWWESCTGMHLYSNKVSKWFGQLCETLRMAVMPIFLSWVRSAESFAQPRTRKGSTSTGGPNLFPSSSLGVRSGLREATLLWWQPNPLIGRLVLTEMPRGAFLRDCCCAALTQRWGNSVENVS